MLPFTQARANHSELAGPAKAGAAKIIAKNGASDGALINTEGLDYHRRLECERIHLLLIEDATRGLTDIEAGRTFELDCALATKKRD